MIKPLYLPLDSRTRFVALNPDNFHRFDFERVTVHQLLASIDFRDENITKPGKDKIEIVIGNKRIYIGLPFAYGNGKLS